MLAEIRKYLEGCDPAEKDKYTNLYFYCDWVFHIKVDKTPAKRILNRFESALLNAKDLKEISRIIIKQEKDFYSFVCLREELLRFFEKDNLPTELLKNGGRWFKFKKLLVEILIDCPLVSEGRKINYFAL